MLQIIQIQPGKDVQITQIPFKYTRVKYPPQTDPSRLNMMQTSVKYPDFKDPPDHTKSRRSYRSCRSCRPTDKNMHIMQIVHTPFRCTDHTDHNIDSTQVDHTDPADYTDPADQWHPPINMLCADHADRANPISLKMYRSADRTDPIPVKLYWLYSSHIFYSGTHLGKL